VALGLVGLTGPASADDPMTAGDKAELQLLKERMAALEERIADRDAQSAGASEGSAILELPSGLHGVQMGGYVDTSYTYSFNEPSTGTTTLRGFDTRANSFMLNQAKLFLAKPASSDSPVGFRTDLIFGTDAEVLSSVETGLGTTDNEELDIQQAYVEYLAPLGDGLHLKAGKFTTLHGAEVTESKDNWNFSRSFLYTWGEPLTHTGVRAHYPVLENVTAMVGVSNGWDVVDDNNKAKTLEFGLTAAPMEGVTWAGTYMVGAEQAADSHDQRHFFSTVLGWDPIEKVHLKLAYDYGFEEDLLSETGGGNASWQGVAAYAKYDVTDKASVAGRLEFFNDQDGARTAVNASSSPTGSPIADLDLMGFTLTGEYKIHEHLISRLEWRTDKADSQIFRTDEGFGSSAQNTIALEFIAPF
jgi:hypothetical protein